MKIVKKSEVLKQQAVPFNSMFSYDRNSGEIEFVAFIPFQPNEILNKTVKFYVVPKDGNKLYLQAISPDMARKKFESFLEYYKNKNQNEKPNVQTQSGKELSQ